MDAIMRFLHQGIDQDAQGAGARGLDFLDRVSGAALAPLSGRGGGGALGGRIAALFREFA